MSKQIIYAWKAKYGGMTVADLSLDKVMLKAVIAKNRWSS